MISTNPGHIHYLEGLVNEGHADFEGYYPKSANGELLEEALENDRDSVYFGRNVAWVGRRGRMVRVTPDNAQHLWGNIFYPDKLASVVEGIQEATAGVAFYAPYGTVSVVDLDTVKESQEYWEDEGLDRPFSTGDEDLDRYLVDPEEVAEEMGWDHDEADGELSYAMESGQGDLGDLTFTIRDGNHRAFGALLAGEPYIYMMISDNQYQRLEELHKRGELRGSELGVWRVLE